MIRRITVTDQAEVLEVTDFFDKRGVRVEPWQAETCVIRLSADRWVDEDIRNVPVYTVH